MAENSAWGYANQALTDPAPAGVDPTGRDMTGLELQWLRKVSGISGLATVADLRKAVFGTSELAYWAATSGLSYGTLTDHKRAAMKVSVPAATGTTTDIERSFYAANLP